MDLASPYIWIPVLVAGIGVVIGASLYGKRKRQRELAAAAEPLGFRRLTSHPFSRSDCKGLPLFRKGYSGRWQTVQGRGDPVNCLTFDYRYTFGLPLVASRIVWQTVIAFQVRGSSLPEFQLAPSTILDRAAIKSGLTALPTGVAQFDQRYWLRGGEPAVVQLLFSPRVALAFLNADIKNRFSVEKTGDWLLVYIHGTIIAPNAVPNFVAFAEYVLNLLQHKNATAAQF